MTYKFKKRLEFVPKGLSPILTEIKEINRPLSPTSKKSLYKLILESYINEINTIKWTNYLENEKGNVLYFYILFKLSIYNHVAHPLRKTRN